MSTPTSLTDQQRAVLQLSMKGVRPKDIAGRLGITAQYVSHIRSKLARRGYDVAIKRRRNSLDKANAELRSLRSIRAEPIDWSLHRFDDDQEAVSDAAASALNWSYLDGGFRAETRRSTP